MLFQEAPSSKPIQGGFLSSKIQGGFGAMERNQDPQYKAIRLFLFLLIQSPWRLSPVLLFSQRGISR